MLAHHETGGQAAMSLVGWISMIGGVSGVTTFIRFKIHQRKVRRK